MTNQQKQVLLDFVDESLEDFNKIIQTTKIVTNLKGVLQNPLYHPEGDAFEHTCQVVFANHMNIKREILLGHRKMTQKRILRLFWAAVFHDVGKKICTQTDPITGKISSINHEHQSVGMAKTFFKRQLKKGFFESNDVDSAFYFDDPDFSEVLILIADHMRHSKTGKTQNITQFVKKWVLPYKAIEVAEDLMLLIIADKSGRNEDGVVRNLVIPDFCQEFLDFMSSNRDVIQKELDLQIEEEKTGKKLREESKPKRVMPFYDIERLKKEFNINPKKDMFVPLIKKFFEEVRQNSFSEEEERELILTIFGNFLIHDDQARPDESSDEDFFENWDWNVYWED